MKKLYIIGELTIAFFMGADSAIFIERGSTFRINHYNKQDIKVIVDSVQKRDDSLCSCSIQEMARIAQETGIQIGRELQKTNR